MDDTLPGEDKRGADAWIENVSEKDRLDAVLATLSEPQSATYIAEEAHVTESFVIARAAATDQSHLVK